MAGAPIKLFKFTQKFCHTIGIYPPQPNRNRYPINSMNLFHLFCLNQLLISVAASLLFGVNSMAEYGLTSYFCLFAAFCDIYCLAAFWQVENISKFIESWEEFIEKREYSTIVYKDANEKIERLTKCLVYCVLATLLLGPISLLSTFKNYYILDFGEESFLLFIPAWYPFNWKTSLGYFVAWLSQVTGCSAILTINSPFYCFLLGSSLLFISRAKDITTDLISFNDNVKKLKHHDHHHVELLESFCAIIQTHSDTKQCVDDFNGICDYLLLSFFTWTMMSVSGSLVSLQFELWNDDSELLELFSSVLICCSIGLIFIFCELGERVTHQFEIFGGEFEKCDWNKLSIEMQRIYLIFLSDTQQSVNIRSYAGIFCSRETFKKIIKTGFSYFLTLRQFEI